MDDIDFMMQLSTDEDSSNSEVETTKQKETIFAFPTSKQLPLKFDPFKLEIFNFPSNFSKKDLMALFSKQEMIKVHKVKMMTHKCASVTFGNENHLERAKERLKSHPVLKYCHKEPLPVSVMENSIPAKSESKAAPFKNMSHNEQLELKRTVVNDTLEILTAKVEDTNYQIAEYIEKQKELHSGLICAFQCVIPSPVLDKYRNKFNFAIGVNPDSEQLTVGIPISTSKTKSYFAVRPITHLGFIPDAMKIAVAILENHFRSSGRKPYQPDRSGFWRQLLIRANLDGEILAVVIVHPQNLTSDAIEQVKADLRSVIIGTHITSLYFQAIGSNKPKDKPLIEHLAGSTHLFETLCGLKFAISPLAFFQTNTLAAEILFQKIGELALLDSETEVLDVCCGIGALGLLLAKNCRRVFGIDMDTVAVADANENAKKNDVSNCIFVEGKAEDLLGELIQNIIGEPNAVKEKKILAIVQSPKAGIKKCISRILRGRNSVHQIILVSSPKAAEKCIVDLCRAKSTTFKGEPFVPIRAVAVDVSPGTTHCELIVVLERYHKVLLTPRTAL